MTQRTIIKRKSVTRWFGRRRYGERVGEFSQEEGTASSQIVIDGNTKYHNTIGGWGFEARRILWTTQRKVQRHPNKGNTKSGSNPSWTSKKRHMGQIRRWDNFEDLKEETEDTLDVKKTKKRDEGRTGKAFTGICKGYRRGWR